MIVRINWMNGQIEFIVVEHVHLNTEDNRLMIQTDTQKFEITLDGIEQVIVDHETIYDFDRL